MIKLIGFFLLLTTLAEAQVSVPFTSDEWTYTTKDYVLEEYQGKQSVLLKRNRLILKNARFEDGSLNMMLLLVSNVDSLP